MESIFLEEVTADVELKLQDGNQENDLKVLFPQFKKPMTKIKLCRGWLEINGGILRWKSYCSSFDTEDAYLLMTPRTLCLYIENDCRAEYPFELLKDIKFCCTTVFGEDLVHHIMWK